VKAVRGNIAEEKTLRRNAPSSVEMLTRMGATLPELCGGKRSEFGGAVAHMRPSSGKAVGSGDAPLVRLHHLLGAAFWAPTQQRCAAGEVLYIAVGETELWQARVS
jgi:hypothetical protein